MQSLVSVLVLVLVIVLFLTIKTISNFYISTRHISLTFRGGVEQGRV
jgi:uncharacterized protein YneF (UPF0154 family)